MDILYETATHRRWTGAPRLRFNACKLVAVQTRNPDTVQVAPEAAFIQTHSGVKFPELCARTDDVMTPNTTTFA